MALGRRITLRDVAHIAGVSTPTVSRVVNGNTKVDPEIQSRVFKAARKLGFNMIDARKNRNIAFVLGNRDTLNEFQSRILLGAENYCAQHGWDLQFISYRSDLWGQTGNVRLPQSLDRAGGVILSGTVSAGVVNALRERRMPFSVVANNVIGDWAPQLCDCVSTDDTRGASEITKHLISMGHRSIYFIGDQRFPWYAHCAEGYRAVMKESGLEPRCSEIRSEDRELGYLATKSLLVNGKRPTAIFAGNDQAAAGVYQALQESGIRVPSDMSVAGFNDTLGDVLFPSLTSAREFPTELGRHLAEFALRRIEQPDTPPQHFLMPTEIVRRESVRLIESSHASRSRS